MGGSNVAAVYRSWAHLDHRPFRLLAGMASVSLDRTGPKGEPAQVYWGGREMTAGLLGYTLETKQAQKTAFREVQRVIAQLIDAGALTHLSSPSERSHARYAVNVDGPPVGWVSDTPVTGGRKTHPTDRPVQVGATPSNGCVSHPPTGVSVGPSLGWVSDTPIGRGDNLDEPIEESSSPAAVVSPAAQRGELMMRENLDQSDALVKFFAQAIEHHTGVAPQARGSWRAAAAALLQQDTPGDIGAVVRFALTDEFWAGKIATLPKLAEHYIQLKLKAQASERAKLTPAQKRRMEAEETIRYFKAQEAEEAGLAATGTEDEPW